MHAFRRLPTALALIVGLFGLWLLGPEFLRLSPTLDTGYTREQVGRAQWAALIAGLRGELWADDAVASIGARLTAGPLTDLQTARRAAERAVTFAPHEARAWLILGALSAAAGADPSRSAAFFKMSYYTGPNEPAIIRPRLLLTARLDATGDPELSELLESDIRTIISQHSAMIGAVTAAYRQAPPATQRLIARVLADQDSGLLKQLETD